jgi:hypothetical protein
MRKTSGKPANDELRREYDLSKLESGVRGKYYQQARAGTNLVVIESDLAQAAFPGEDSVNRALRLLLTTAKAATTGESRKSKSRPEGRLRTRRSAVRD